MAARKYRWVKFKELRIGDVFDWSAGTDKAGDPYPVRVHSIYFKGGQAVVNDEYEAPSESETVVLSAADVAKLRRAGHYIS